MKTLETDVLVVGGGPAGASTALSLLNYSNLKVVLVEQSDLSGHRIGENVSASIFNLLDYLKIDKNDLESDWICPTNATVSLWGNEYPVTIDPLLSSSRSSYQIDRQKLDFHLLQTIADRGGIVLPRTRYINISRPDNSSWNIDVSHATKGKLKIACKFLVDATGRKASLCKHLKVPTQRLDTLMGVGIFFDENKATENPKVQCIESTESGWWYTSHLPKGKRIIVFFSDAKIIAHNHFNEIGYWTKNLSKTREIKKWYSLNHPPLKEELWIKDASSRITNTSQINNFIAVGDAASSFDPISSMGIGFAMTSSFHAARHIKNIISNNFSSDSNHYQKNIEEHYHQYVSLRDQFYNKENRWNSYPFWAKRLPGSGR
ncbi:lysine-epsilon-oxidase maturase LodB [Membranihabitans maritimus]|uniref:lysine-epsilon-oxidase maturase LodB n=1 Tax=Membranihabitans maritimus TaxID=2904244 RepID=UPI001F3529B2|nr:lysine-epsilon-oxidase maturase LodB [Membranihabitans maritimus]